MRDVASHKCEMKGIIILVNMMVIDTSSTDGEYTKRSKRCWITQPQDAIQFCRIAKSFFFKKKEGKEKSPAKI